MLLGEKNMIPEKSKMQSWMSNLQVLVQPTQPNENVVEDEEAVIHHLVVCHFAFRNYILIMTSFLNKNLNNVSFHQLLFFTNK